LRAVGDSRERKCLNLSATTRDRKILRAKGSSASASYGVALADYPNTPPTVASCISSGKATLKELWEDYGLEAMYVLLEVIRTDAHNRHLWEEAARKRTRRGGD